jgi:elongator complex protein 3
MPSKAPNQWREARDITSVQAELARQVLLDVVDGLDIPSALRRHPQPDGKGYLAKHTLVAVYRQMIASGELEDDGQLLARIRMKPMRTLSGVTTVTVLTKPYPCPGDCIFCPTDVRLPKSYLVDEPGAARAFQQDFDPYLQVRVRLDEYDAIGHPSEKIELLILGGTWSAYRRDYQEWFVRRCFDALNGSEADSLEAAHQMNETASHRCVGLVVETRPDEITPAELAWLRRLGVTKVQLGVQSLDDRLLEINRRGHTSARALQACQELRAAGFKIVLHWMPNLLGATPDSDRQDFARLWDGYDPDELKIYPTQLLENSDLYAIWQAGGFSPYSTEVLTTLLADLKEHVPPYCRINRVIRDIPSHHVVDGNRRTSLRQDVLAEMARRGTTCQCIRCREVRGEPVDPNTLQLVDHVYHPVSAEEHFLHYVTPSGQIAGYLRLSLPEHAPAPELAELEGAALIREVHVYGQSLPVGGGQAGAAQHVGLGRQLIEKACDIAVEHHYHQLAVIAAVGTRKYYENRGFVRGDLYMHRSLNGSGTTLETDID